MTQTASDGRLVTLDEAKNLVDHKGKLIEFKEGENGLHTATGSESDGNTFTYTLEPVGKPQYIVRIEKKAKGSSDVNESGQKTVGDTFKQSDKTKAEFVADYGTPNQNKPRK